MKKINRVFGVTLAAMIALTGLLFGQSSSPQDSPSIQTSMDQNIDLMRKDIRSQKKQIIAANLQLTDKEAEKFWPLYDQYTAELVKINDTKYGAIKDYAANYTTLTDDQALDLIRKPLQVDEAVAQLRLRYIPVFGKVLSGKKTALFFQLDRRLLMLIDTQLAAQIPLIQP
ncbi:MAG TPA: hypothetical protein VEK33_10545 [Terriglobales bacterium]|nr:hypothetical protein [Terriglobales bacterium]